MLVAQLTRVPLAEQKWKHHQGRFLADVLNFLEVDQRKCEAVPTDKQNRTWLSGVEHVFAKMTSDRISTLIDTTIIRCNANHDCSETSCGSDAQSERLGGTGRPRDELRERENAKSGQRRQRHMRQEKEPLQDEQC